MRESSGTAEDQAYRLGRPSLHPDRGPFHATLLDSGHCHGDFPSTRKFDGLARELADHQRHPLSRWTLLMERYSWTVAPIIWAVSILHSGSMYSSPAQWAEIADNSLDGNRRV